MATWKKVIVSGSSATLANLVVDANISASGVISGSFFGDGSNLTGVSAAGTLSGSAQIAGNISGSLSAAHLNTKVPGIFSGSAQLPSGIVSGAAQLPSSIVSSSAQTIANLPAGTVSGSAQLPSGIISGAAQLPAGTISGSAQVNANTVANFDDNVDSRINAKGVVSGSAQITLQDADKTGFTGNNTITTLGTVVAGDVAAILPAGVVSGSAQITAGSNTISSSAQLATDISGSFSAAHLNAKVTGVVSASAFSSPSQGTVRATINGVQTDVDTGLQTGDSPQFTDVTVTGNLTVNGTTTTVDSTTVEFADNIIALNGTAAAKGGLAVNDSNGPASGSLLWDGANNYWVAGPTGSETKVFRAGATGDGLVSGSGQIPALLPAGTVSGSAQTKANLPTGTVSSSAQTVANLPGGTVSGSAQTVANLSNQDVNLGTGDITAVSGAFDYIGDKDTILTGSFRGDGSGLTGVTAAGTLSSSAQIADNISGSFSKAHLAAKIAGVVSGSAQVVGHLPAGTVSGSSQLPAGIISGAAQLPGGTVSGSAQTVANLSNQDVNLGTGDITAISASFDYVGDKDTILTGSFRGDGSELQNLTVSQTATVESTFTNATTASVTHNFGSRNVIVSVYGTDNEQLIPSTVRLSSVNALEVHLGSSTSGKVIVAQGGHLVSGSVPYANLLNVPTGILSSSAQIAGLNAGIISSSAQIDADLFDIDGLVSSSTQVVGHLPAGTISGSSQLPGGIISGAAQLPAGTVSGSAQVVGHLPAGTLSGSAQIGSAISGSFTATSASIASDIAGISTSFTLAADSGTNDSFSSGGTLTFAGTANEINTTVTNDQIQIGLPDDVTIGGALTVTGDLTVTGNTIEQQVTNLNVEDQFILLNSGSGAQDAGLVINGQGAAFGWDESANRFALDFSGATFNQTALAADAFVAAVVTSDDANYQKVGNIRIDGDDIYIYS